MQYDETTPTKSNVGLQHAFREMPNGQVAQPRSFIEARAGLNSNVDMLMKISITMKPAEWDNVRALSDQASCGKVMSVTVRTVNSLIEYFDIRINAVQ